MSGTDGAKTRLIQDRALPLIGGLERYRSEQGSYPAALSALVPRYVSNLPKCAEADAGPMPYWLENSGKSFEIACPIGMFAKYGYSSASAKWHSFD